MKLEDRVERLEEGQNALLNNVATSADLKNLVTVVGEGFQSLNSKISDLSARIDQEQSGSKDAAPIGFNHPPVTKSRAKPTRIEIDSEV